MNAFTKSVFVEKISAAAAKTNNIINDYERKKTKMDKKSVGGRKSLSVLFVSFMRFNFFLSAKRR